MKKSLAINAIYKIVLNLCNIVIPVIIGPYVLRVLDREYYDVFNGLNAPFQVFLLIGALGIYNYGVREVSKVRGDKEQCNKFFSEMFVFSLFSNLLTMIIYLIISFVNSNNLEWILSVILCIQFFGNLFNVEWINEANENYKFIAIKSIIIRLIYLVGIFLLVRKADDIIWYVLLLVLSTFINTFVSYIYIKKYY